jgi:hypothetical protein
LSRCLFTEDGTTSYPRHARPPLPATLVYLLILEYVVAHRN